MKQLLSILAFVLISSTLAAQDVPTTSMKKTWGSSGATDEAFDTLKTTAAVYLYSGPILGAKNIVTVTATATELSGTTGGTANLEVSADGVSWSSYYASKDSTYSQTLADVATAQVYRWVLYDVGDNYFRIKWAGSGTVSVLLTGSYSAKTYKRQ